MAVPKKPNLGAAFKPAADEKKPLGDAFREGPRAKIPPVVVIHPLPVFREVLERHGWPRDAPDINAAQEAALIAGHLDLAAVENRYGMGAWQRERFVVLPAVDGQEDAPGVFRAVREGDVVRLLPPALAET